MSLRIKTSGQWIQKMIEPNGDLPKHEFAPGRAVAPLAETPGDIFEPNTSG
jgi:hypothetical protein